MAGIATQSIDGARLRHQIVLLSVLNDVPGSPEENAPSLGNSGCSSSQFLSFSQEQTLVEAFAFLASTTHDPRKVVAVALEVQEAGRLLVRLATNHGGLAHAQTGLQRLGKVLLRSGRGDWTADRTATEMLFHAAAAMHQNRILARLRSRHAVLQCNYKKEKLRRPKIIPQLYSAIRVLYHAATPSATRTEHKNLWTVVDSLNETFLTLENLNTAGARARPGLEIILVILRACHRLHAERILPKVLDDCSGLDLLSKAKIVSILAKLSRYWTISKFLHKMSCELQHFDIFEVRTAQYGAKSHPISALDVHMSQVIHGIYNEERWRKVLSRRKLDSDADIHTFVSKEASLQCPVHAEVQLLWYYETTHSGAKPRIISSSKKACFLCNLFFKFHGGYFVPSTHGKLYTKWGLPKLDRSTPPRIRTALQNLIDAIDARVQDELISPQRLKLQPCESAIFPSAACSYTTRSDSGDTVLPESAHCQSVANSQESDTHRDPEAPIESASMPPHEDRLSCSITSNSASSLDLVSGHQILGEQGSQVTIPRPLGSANQDHPNQELVFAHPMRRRINTATPAIVISIPELQLTLHYDVTAEIPPAMHTHGATDLLLDHWVEVHWCDQGVAQASNVRSAVDVGRLAPGSEVAVKNTEGTWPWSLLVLYGGDEIVMTFHH